MASCQRKLTFGSVFDLGSDFDDMMPLNTNIERLQQACNSAEPLRLPVSYFNVEPEQILLYMSCLEPVEMIAEEFAANTTEQPRLVNEVLSE